MISTPLPAPFLEMARALPGVDNEAFIASLDTPPAVSIKLNRRKCADPAYAEYPDTEPVEWCDSGFYLSERPQFTLNPLLHAGHFYVQDASSMIYEEIVRRILPMVSDTDAPAVLDLCAAPGGKTTSMINALPDTALVLANEFVGQRANVLTENLIKWGFGNIMVSSSATDRVARMEEAFDIVAVDAPCSGEGMMRKDETARTQWTPGLVKQCARLQRGILADAIAALRPGGFLIYSTCTFNTEENEENLRYLVEEMDMIPVDILPDFSGVGRQISGPYPALRFMPHITRGEGLFAAVLRKPGEAAPTPHKRIRRLAADKTRLILPEIPKSVLKGKTETPTTEWTLSTSFPAGSLPACEVDLDTALNYLRHEAVRLPEEIPSGLVVITYRGARLGLVKNLGQRANNLYPKQWRIRNL